MNKAKLKSYAPAARRDFIQAVTDRAHFFGLSETETIPVVESGDFAMIGGNSFPRIVGAQRRKLEARVKRDGFSQVMEAVAYTWFNRFLALRYMELHGYLEHGFRVLSNIGSSNVPEILDHAAQLDMSGLNKQRVVELKLDGSKDAELYRMLLVAQCNALHAALPFLFEKIEDETELLLPDNLLHSDSLIRKLVAEIEEEDWQEVEIIGWLYQFYISEKKDQVIGKVVKSEDIPAATQLFTPDWIVKYMVQNSLGRQWQMTYPNSPLKTKMEYYIEPAVQTDEVKSQLAAITPDSLDPEKLTLLDPASGSGHILVEAYDVFKEIYLERGYSSRDFPRLILEKNLFGLDVDDRAAQMAGFALLMKARRDDRRILRSDNPVKLNVMAIQESGSISVENSQWGEQAGTIRALTELFKYGKTFGSLIQVPARIVAELSIIETSLNMAMLAGDLYTLQAARELLPLVEQGRVLAGKYNCVVANPPYMGSKGMNDRLKAFAQNNYPDSKSDLFAMFIERNLELAAPNGTVAMITMQSWMFLSSFERLRERLLSRETILSMAHLGTRAFDSIGGEVVSTTAFVLGNYNRPEYEGSYLRLIDGNSELEKISAMRNAIENPDCGWFNSASAADFMKLPGIPISYWISKNTLSLFNKQSLSDYFFSEGPCKTGNDEIYLRLFWEVSRDEVSPDQKWCFCSKGGEHRRYFGNIEHVIRWDEESRAHYRNDRIGRITSEHVWNEEGITWSIISSKAGFSFRVLPHHAQFNSVSPTIFAKDKSGGAVRRSLLFLNSTVAGKILSILNPTLALNVGNVLSLPFVKTIREFSYSDALIEIAKSDWDSYETSWDFTRFPLLNSDDHGLTLKVAYAKLRSTWLEMTLKMRSLEEENNRVFIEAYNLFDELTPEVPLNEITLTCNPYNRYGKGKSENELETLLLADTMKELISYTIGCMMGRYSCDQLGMMYAHNGSLGFDHSKYQTFPADDDGIVPVLDTDLFPDDATNRFEEFLKVAWSPEALEENLRFVADSLSPKGGETPRETIRRYISTQFYKDHMQTYKKRPIYWLFSSGKQRAFECLVYLHRYNDATLSRMRNEYVTPLQGKFSAQVDYLSNEINAAASTAERNRLQKQLDTLRKKQVELASFDDLLRHYADQRISLDLDAGVKVNYGKFGSLLAEAKAVTGGTD